MELGIGRYPFFDSSNLHLYKKAGTYADLFPPASTLSPSSPSSSSSLFPSFSLSLEEQLDAQDQNVGLAASPFALGNFLEIHPLSPPATSSSLAISPRTPAQTGTVTAFRPQDKKHCVRLVNSHGLTTAIQWLDLNNHPGTIIERGQVVWAKMKGYPFWPAQMCRQVQRGRYMRVYCRNSIIFFFFSQICQPMLHPDLANNMPFLVPLSLTTGLWVARTRGTFSFAIPTKRPR
jgi:hypothetical protein